MRCGLALALGAGLLGCATPSPHAEASRLDRNISHGEAPSGPVQHYSLTLGQTFTGGVPLIHPVPVYPPTLVAERLPPQAVEALLIVDAHGKVSEVHIADEVDAQRRLFARAVRDAAMQWTFEPLRANRWAANANSEQHEVDSETQPFSVTYVFRFEWKDGRPTTTATAATEPSH